MTRPTDYAAATRDLYRLAAYAGAVARCTTDVLDSTLWASLAADLDKLLRQAEARERIADSARATEADATFAAAVGDGSC
jgi:hypothetical protein